MLIEQKAEVWGNYNQCDKERAVKAMLVDTYARQNTDQRRLLDSQQQTFNQCILTLGSANKPERQVTQAYPVGTIDQHISPPLRSADFVIVTNRTITPVRLLVTCDGTIDHASAMVLGSAAFMIGGWGGSQSSHKYGVGISSPAWTPMGPLLVNPIFNRCKSRQLRFFRAIKSCRPEHRLYAQFAHFMNEHNEVMTENFTERFVDHRHVGLAPQAVTKLALHHGERRFNVAFVVVLQELLFAEIEVVVHFGPLSTSKALVSFLNGDKRSRTQLRPFSSAS